MDKDMELINRLARKPLSQEEVYTFEVKLCDNKIDRDLERFPRESLEELAELFVGKRGVFGHNWAAPTQQAMIYKTELAIGDDRNSMGEPYVALMGYAYMPRNENNQPLVEKIESGIKREVSISCAAGRKICSVCGSEAQKCEHEAGKWYDGLRCCWELVDIKYAYEWAFVVEAD